MSATFISIFADVINDRMEIKMSQNVKKYISISKLSKEKQPELFEKEGKGYFYIHHEAQTCVCHNGEPMCYLGYVEFAPLRSRGNHYHCKKHENICIITGTVKARFVLPNKLDEVYEIILEKGDIVHIIPGCAHSFLSEHGAVALEYSPEKYEKTDTIRCSFKWEEEIH